MKKQASWNNQTLAESDDLVNIEGNYYFPMESIKKEFFVNSDTITGCPWKGSANYFSIKVEGQVNEDAAWYYAEPKPAAKSIKGRVAFWKGVQVVDV